MRRRDLIFLLGGAAAWPSAARGQAPGTRPLIACLSAGQFGTVPIIAAFQEGMRELGYYAGRNVEVVYRFAENRLERLPALADELVRLNPAVIVAPAIADVLAARQVTAMIPIVSAALVDPVNLGLVASMTRPGGNVTGIMSYVSGLSVKQMELAREIVPGAGRIGILGDLDDVDAPRQRRELEDGAGAFGGEVAVPEVRTPSDLEGAVATLVNKQVDVVIVLQTRMLITERRQIADLVAAKRLPTVYGYREHVDVGGLTSYGVDLSWCGRRAATYVQTILAGAAPGELRVESAPRIELVVNQKTAKTLGLTLPPALLTRADEVIE
jgi:putative ABC transport system substrate-binding protein